MKKTILTTAILSALLIGCKDNTSNVDKASEMMEEVHGDGSETYHDYHSVTAMNNDWVKEIELDNGEKWNANIETNEGVEKMLKLVKSGDPKTVEDYHEMAATLNADKNYVVEKCNMTGPSHDNLHVFLVPLMEKIDALGKVSTTGEGAEITAAIEENLEDYYNYFK